MTHANVRRVTRRLVCLASWVSWGRSSPPGGWRGGSDRRWGQSPPPPPPPATQDYNRVFQTEFPFPYLVFVVLTQFTGYCFGTLYISVDAKGLQMNAINSDSKFKFKFNYKTESMPVSLYSWHNISNLRIRLLFNSDCIRESTSPSGEWAIYSKVIILSKSCLLLAGQITV